MAGSRPHRGHLLWNDFREAHFETRFLDPVPQANGKAKEDAIDEVIHGGGAGRSVHEVTPGNGQDGEICYFYLSPSPNVFVCHRLL